LLSGRITSASLFSSKIHQISSNINKFLSTVARSGAWVNSLLLLILRSERDEMRLDLTGVWVGAVALTARNSVAKAAYDGQ
jgi:hypothetical protein